MISGQILRSIRDRNAKINKLIDEYNAALSELPPDPRNPPQLSKQITKQLLAFDSDLFETDRFLCNHRWASEKGMRRAIIVANTLERAKEELMILSREMERFVNSLCHSLFEIQINLQVFKSGSCKISEILVEKGGRIAQALRELQSKRTSQTLRRLSRYSQATIANELQGSPSLCGYLIHRDSVERQEEVAGLGASYRRN